MSNSNTPNGLVTLLRNQAVFIDQLKGELDRASQGHPPRTIKMAMLIARIGASNFLMKQMVDGTAREVPYENGGMGTHRFPPIPETDKLRAELQATLDKINLHSCCGDATHGCMHPVVGA